MSLQRLDGSMVGNIDLTPFAMLQASIGGMHKELGIEFETEVDDLDEYQVAYFALNGKVFAFMHHRGEPPETVNIYMQRDMPVKDAEKAMSKILKHFGIGVEQVTWPTT
jgi:hypothetical protein